MRRYCRIVPVHGAEHVQRAAGQGRHGRRCVHPATLRREGIESTQAAMFYIDSHLNIKSAAAIGLVPPELPGRVYVLGNAALAD